MTAKEPVTIKLGTIKDLIAAGDQAAALEQLNALLAEEAVTEAHLLRLQIAVQNVREHATLIAESLESLQRDRTDEAVLSEYLVKIQDALTPRLEEIHKAALAEEGASHHDEIKDYGPLGKHLPYIYLVTGQVLLSAIRQQDDPEEPEDILDSILKSRFSGKSSLPKPDSMMKTATEAFKQALDAFPVDSNHHLEALHGLAMLYETAESLPDALHWYEAAQAAGLAVEDKIRLLRQGVINESVSELMDYVDRSLAIGNLEAVLPILDFCAGLARYPFYQLRWADYQFLKGDHATAGAFYERYDGDDFSVQVEGPEINGFNIEGLKARIEALASIEDNAKGGVAFKGHPWLFVRYELDAKDFSLRPLCGRIAIAWQREDYATVQTLMQRLLNTHKLSSGGVVNLLMDINTVEKLTQETALVASRGAREKAWRQADWSAFRRYAQEAVRQIGANDVDTVWLAAALYKAGDGVEAQSYLLKHLAPDLIRELPPVLGRELLRSLARAGCWDVTDRFVDTVSNAGGWRAAYARQRDDYLAQWYATTQQAFDQAFYEQALAQVRNLLMIEPHHPQGRLLLAQLRFRDGFYAEARQITEGLLSEANITEAATVLLVRIDMVEGYLLDAEQRLVTLPEATAASLRLALNNRLEQRPYVHLETVEELVSADVLIRRKAAPVTAAIFAVELKSVRSVREAPPVAYHCFTLLTALERGTDQLGLQVSFAWRYIAEAGQLRVLLLCRVEAPYSDQARYAAESLWQTIRGLLPLQDEQIYNYEPVTEPSLLDYVRMPEGLGSALEITRQEVGVRNGEKGDIPLIHPFSYSMDDLHRALRLLLEQPRKTVMDIHFQPTALFAWERSAIQNMLGDHFYANTQENGIRYMLGEERYYQAMKIYPDFLMKADWMAFVTRIHLASVGDLSPALPNVVATGLFGPSRYALVPATTETDLATVQRNLYEITAERWGYAVPVPRLERLPYLLTVGEALSATRLPVPGPDGLPGMAGLKVKATPLPSNLPTEGTLIGEGVSSVRGRPVPVKISTFDRMRHTYVVGRTGTGKSTLLQNMALQDIEEGHGVAVIDPHGDLVEAILERIPPHRVQDVVLFDPSDTERPIGLNTLDVTGTFEKNMVVAEFIGLMYSLFDPNKVGIVGPRFENAVRNAMLTAMAIPGNTLIEVVRILSERSYLKDTLAIITDPVVKGYWEDIVGNMSDFHKSEVLDYITSKFGRFITDHLIRNIIGQSKNSLDFADIMDSGKILLVNLAKGKIGPQNSHFLGLLLVPRLLIAALSRARMGVAQRRLFCLYVDEFHNFTTPAFSVMLSEARKYGMALTMANQFISQLDNDIRESVFGNVGTLLAFQVGIKDAQFIAPEMYPVFNVDDMVNLPNYHLLGKMLIKGAVAPQFALRTLPDTRLASSETANAIRELSRQRYGRNEGLVTHEINQRFSLKPKERMEMMQQE